jgi:hypothetical protein
MAFNPNEHLMQLKGKDYLQVAWRLVWFRDQCPKGSIETQLIDLDKEKQIALFRATISDGQGGLATGHGSESAKDFGDYLEKAETKAVGRALAMLGFGTQFAPELDEEHCIVDSPVERKPKPQSRSGVQEAQGEQPEPDEPATEQQLASLRNLARLLSREVEPPATYAEAKQRITELSMAYRQSRAQRAS